MTTVREPCSAVIAGHVLCLSPAAPQEKTTLGPRWSKDHTKPRKTWPVPGPDKQISGASHTIPR